MPQSARTKSTSATTQALPGKPTPRVSCNGVARDMLDLLGELLNGNRFIIFMNDRYSKITCAVPVSKMRAVRVALMIIDNWVLQYFIPNFLLTNDGPQFVSKFFNALCGSSGVKQPTPAAYYPQMKGQTERYNKTIVSRLHPCVNKHHTNWYRFVQTLT